MYRPVKVEFSPQARKEVYRRKSPPLTSDGACETSEHRSGGVVEPLHINTPCGEQGIRTMAKYCVPILALRHAYALVDAESERDALVKGWESFKANQCKWLYETVSVETPFLQLTEEDFGWEDIPEDLGTARVSLVNQRKNYVSQLLHTQK